MAAKPSGVWSVVVVVIGAAIGFAVSAAQLRALPSNAAGDRRVPSQRQLTESA
jgi:hypothetical protein